MGPGATLKPLELKRFRKLLSRLPGDLGLIDWSGVSGGEAVLSVIVPFLFVAEAARRGVELAEEVRKRDTDRENQSFFGVAVGVETCSLEMR